MQVATKIDAPVKLLAPNPPGRHAAVFFFPSIMISMVLLSGAVVELPARKKKNAALLLGMRQYAVTNQKQ